MQPKDPKRKPFPSRWLPSYVRMARDSDGAIKYPKTGVATVVEAADRWEQLMGPLDGTTKAIVEGRFVVPRRGWLTRRSWLKNHSSWEDDERAKEALGPKIGQYFYQGILEWVPPRAQCLPANISPLAAVDKSTDPFYRMVQDAREPNEGVAPWKVKYYTVVDLAMMLDYGDIMFALDFSDAYHLTALPGCHCGRREERWVELGQDGQWVWRSQVRLGCTGQDCAYFCDKSMAAVCIGGQMARVAASHFGQATAGSPLAYLVNTVRRHYAARKKALGPAPRRWLGRGSLPSVVWVDDTVWNLKSERHGVCGGLRAGCVDCQLLLVEAEGAMSEVEEGCEAVHMWLSKDKKQGPSQSVCYTGIVVDTELGRYFCPEEKLVKLVESLRELQGRTRMSARGIAGVRGKVLHYSICIPYIRVYAVWFSHIIGSDGEVEWDRLVHLPGNSAEVCEEIISTIEARHRDGVPMWPYVPSSLYRYILGGDLCTGKGRVHIVCDASFEGWGARVEGPGVDLLVASTFTESEVTVVQVRREALGVHLAFKAASQLIDLRGMVVLHRNDCTGALTAMRKGSFASRPMQDISVRFTRRCARLRTENYFLHASGKQLVAEGIDAASRDLALQVSFPACTLAMRGRGGAERMAGNSGPVCIGGQRYRAQILRPIRRAGS